MPPQSAGRVAGRHYYLPAPSEPDVLVSSHPAQALDNVPAVRRTRWLPIGLGVHLDVTAAEPATDMTSVAAVAPAEILATSPTFLHHSLRRLANHSRPPTPEGSLPAFAEGAVATPIRSITDRPLLSPPSFTRSPSS